MKQEYSVKINDKTVYETYVSKTRRLIESELLKLVSNLSKLNLHSQIEYEVLSEGKRLRPLLTILSAESVGGNRDKVMSLALAFELMHTATLIHDDVIDQDEMRRGKPALHMQWSVNDAILTGDALIALSVDLASGYGETILKTVAQSALQLCDGEHIDITLSLRKATEEMYFRKIKEKSASLFKAAAYCGALAAGGSPLQASALASFGENYGIAYQLRDDIQDIKHEGNMVSKDLKSARVTLPLIHMYLVSNAREKKQLESGLRKAANNKGFIDSAFAEEILLMLAQKHSVAYCEKKVNQHLNAAITSLEPLRRTECRNYLCQMAEALKFKA